MTGELVLLHGFTQTGRSWAPVLAELGERYRAFAPDLPGHGSQSHRRPASIAAAVAYVRALKAQRMTLCGYSQGGRIALTAALELGPRIERLVLVSASPGIAQAQERAARRAADEELARRIEEVGVEAFAEEWARQPLLAGLPRGVAELARADRLRNTADGLAAALRGMGQGAMEPLWERLRELTVPVTLVVGERDVRYRAIASDMAARLSDVQLVVAPGCGHSVHLERPEFVAAAVAARDRLG